ncbi:quorum-quenching N-acyl-homoserine lactonase RmmL [Epibacterium sp. Ofav1-8]|uniref:quorum-quenching N-acyl-homoserine lactonase RmmL n=1 Tax=Epibacterium sp. Ofav1-8 TaxID=2917735 RepID=UPI001EF62B5B|nr:MBL fold metallo-hydrolase [Epibacterium sp. Ofav1-8]MCG7623370.1 MBL fold metallo-hydrolase [Epibacterium sp. Ofav1-8]
MTLSRRTLLKTLGFGAASLSLPAFGRLAQAAPAGPAPVLHQIRLGEMTITALLDGHLAVPAAAFTGYDAARAEETLSGSFYSEGPQGLEIPVNGYLVERGGQYTLVDTGTAQLMGPDLGGLMAALSAAGVAPAQISTVLLTHMHPDHAGGLLAADGSAAFPNAELVVAEAEWAFWHDDAIMASVDEGSRGFFQMARNAVAPYAQRRKVFAGEGEVLPGFDAMPLPGHTPGHSGFMLDTGATPLLIWGDVVHSTALQFANPGWTIPFDVDQPLAAETRKAMFDRAAADQLLVTGMHLDFPGLGRVERDGAAYAFDQAPWQFGL